tara:strand:+ start:634 stop:1758 length:1125 start_codon:yes stop_codon:yes gene_type:complete
MNHLDLFSGIGGFSLGLHQAGINPKWIGFSDIDKFANKVFKRRFPNAKELGDIELIRPNDLPRIDLVTFGFPCQDLSIAGRRGGLQANRSSLFFKAIEIIRVKKPKYFIFENVKGLFSSNGGKDFDIVLRAISDIGYDGQWQLVNTRWFLPQNRERVYFIGHIRGECRPKVFPICENGRKNSSSRGGEEAMISNAPSREYGWKDVSPTLCARDYKDPKLVKLGVVGKDTQATRVYDSNGLSATLSSLGGGLGAKTGLYKIHCTQQRGAKRPSLTAKCDCGSGKLKKKCCGTGGGSGHLSTYEQVMYCLNTNSHTIAVEKDAHIRRLTPKECERLQGFPDNWTDGQSDSQRYKQCGNAVSVPVVKTIMENLYEKR